MHEFRIDGRHPAGMGRAQMRHSARVGEVLMEAGSSLTYTYDLGDSWEHSVVLKKRIAGGDGAGDPVCLEGEQACPPEDCGGVPGYYDLLEVLQHPDDERYEEMREWIGADFDAHGFSADAVNRQLRSGGGRRRRSG